MLAKTASRPLRNCRLVISHIDACNLVRRQFPGHDWLTTVGSTYKDALPDVGHLAEAIPEWLSYQSRSNHKLIPSITCILPRLNDEHRLVLPIHARLKQLLGDMANNVNIEFKIGFYVPSLSFQSKLVVCSPDPHHFGAYPYDFSFKIATLVGGANGFVTANTDWLNNYISMMAFHVLQTNLPKSVEFVGAGGTIGEIGPQVKSKLDTIAGCSEAMQKGLMRVDVLPEHQLSLLNNSTVKPLYELGRA